MGFFRHIKEAFLLSLKDFWPFFRGDWAILLPMFIFIELMSQYFLHVQALAAYSQLLLIAGIFGKMSVSLMSYVILVMLVPQRLMERDKGLPRGSFWAFTSRHMWPFTLESVRALAHVILWTLLLILPGIYKYIRFFFVPYVVLCDETYQKGERDALTRSEELSKGGILPLFLLFVLIFVLEMGGETLREKVLRDPLIPYGIPGLVFLAGAVILLNILLFRLYQLRVKALDHSGG